MRARASAKKSKYGVRTDKIGKLERTIDGITFSSKAEARRYRELRLLEKAGEITRLVCQPVWPLLVTPLGDQPVVKVRVGEYRGDFQYDDGCGVVVEDVKGVTTPVYRLKKKLVEALYGITIREIPGRR